jgi:N-acetyl-anhydromuramoyl-L-alanine amidase
MLNVKFRNLPHFDDRPAGAEIDTLIVHSMCAGPNESVDVLDCLARLDECKVAAHYLITREGEIWQAVDESKRAWHAGVSRMPSDGRENVNHFSIGVELLAGPAMPFSDGQYAALASLAKDILGRHPIRHILGHEHIAPGRKTDPGSGFSWPRFKDELQALGIDLSSLSFP